MTALSGREAERMRGWQSGVPGSPGLWPDGVEEFAAVILSEDTKVAESKDLVVKEF